MARFDYADDLVSSRPIFRGWGSIFGIWSSLHIRCTRKEERALRSGVLANCLTLEPGPLPQNTDMEKCCFLLLGCFAGVRLVGRHCVALGGLHADRRGERCWHGCLGACELLSRHMFVCLGAMAVNYFREISTSEQIFVFLVSGSSHSGRISFYISCISFSKV